MLRRDRLPLGEPPRQPAVVHDEAVVAHMVEHSDKNQATRSLASRTSVNPRGDTIPTLDGYNARLYKSQNFPSFASDNVVIMTLPLGSYDHWGRCGKERRDGTNK